MNKVATITLAAGVGVAGVAGIGYVLKKRQAAATTTATATPAVY
ncbi:MAG: hypothetical protein ACYCOU_01060 [Sulfobacillus sp.]